jgi:hypothetical protein
MVIKEGLGTPYVKLDKENGVLSIIGKSYTDNPTDFYVPIVDVLHELNNTTQNNNFTVKVALEIINSVSSKYIFFLFKILYDMYDELIVKWYYESDDEIMFEMGKSFKGTFTESDFNLIGVTDLRGFFKLNVLKFNNNSR